MLQASTAPKPPILTPLLYPDNDYNISIIKFINNTIAANSARYLFLSETINFFMVIPHITIKIITKKGR